MAWTKPKHRKSGAPVVEKDYSPQLSMPGVSDVVELREEPWPSIIKGWAGGLVWLLIFVVVAAGLLYTAVSATLFTADKLGEDEYSLVVRSQWRDTGGKPPIGEEAVVSLSTPLSDNPLELVKQGYTGIPHGSVVKILTTDHADVFLNPTEYTVTLADGSEYDLGSNLGYSMPVKEADPKGSTRLNRQYIVECISGACEPGTAYLIGQDQIFGKQRSL